MWFKWTKYSDQTNFEAKYCMNKIRIHWKVLRVRFTWSKYMGVAAFLWPKYQNSIVMKIDKDVVIMWLAWQTWLTQPGKFNLQLLSPSWNYDPNIRMRLDPKKDRSTPSLHPKFWCYISGPKSGSCGQMIYTIPLVSFSGSTPDIWFKHQPEP